MATYGSFPILHKPASILKGVGVEPAAPDPLDVVPVAHFHVDLFDVAPRPIVPARFLRATSPAVAARRSVIELLAVEGEVRLRYFGPISVSAKLAIQQATGIQANSAAVTSGTQLGTLSAQVLIGDRAGELDGFEILSNFGIENLQLPGLPAGWRYVFQGAADNTALVLDLAFAEYAGRLDRIEGA